MSIHEEIECAFRNEPYPGDTNLVVDPRDPEGADTVERFVGKDWIAVRDASDILSFVYSAWQLTTEALRYYLPAFLTRMLDTDSQADIAEVLSTILCPSDGWERSIILGALSPAQRRVIYDCFSTVAFENPKVLTPEKWEALGTTYRS